MPFAQPGRGPAVRNLLLRWRNATSFAAYPGARRQDQTGDVEMRISPESAASEVLLREVREDDLPFLFEHQSDPAANQMAAFPARDREAFMSHWLKILDDDSVIKSAIQIGTEVAGHVVCFEQSGRLLIGYWLGRSLWGRGIASRAVAEFVAQVRKRPLYAHVAKHNAASIRVLEKCGFAFSEERTAVSSAGSEAVDEFILTLVR